MNIAKYRKLVEDTAIFPKETGLMYCALGLNGEAGEVAEKIKKFIRDGGELDRHAVAKELGDVLWYITALGQEIGYGLNLIMMINHDKLTLRKEHGLIKGSGDDREEFKENLKKITEPKWNTSTTAESNRPSCEFCITNKGMTCNDCSTSNKPI